MRLVGPVALLGALAMVVAAGCGTDAVGVDDCRSIEQTRCDYAATCGITSDVDACKRFYRDQCLHGLAGGQPSRLDLNVCLKTIRTAGACAKQGKDTPLDTCDATTKDGPVKACDVILAPEQTVECSFLAAVPVTPYSDASDAKSDAGDGSTGDATAD